MFKIIKQETSFDKIYNLDLNLDYYDPDKTISIKIFLSILQDFDLTQKTKVAIEFLQQTLKEVELLNKFPEKEYYSKLSDIMWNFSFGDYDALGKALSWAIYIYGKVDTKISSFLYFINHLSKKYNEFFLDKFNNALLLEGDKPEYIPYKKELYELANQNHLSLENIKFAISLLNDEGIIENLYELYLNIFNKDIYDEVFNDYYHNLTLLGFIRKTIKE